MPSYVILQTNFSALLFYWFWVNLKAEILRSWNEKFVRRLSKVSQAKVYPILNFSGLHTPDITKKSLDLKWQLLEYYQVIC